MTKKPVDMKWVGFKNRASGEHAEILVKAALQRLGLRMVEKVNTPWKVIFRDGPGGRRTVQHAFPVEKVSGDFRAVEPSTGRSVLVESKNHDADTLPFSTFRPHQILALTQNHEAKGLSLMAWVRKGEVHLIEWPAPGFGVGKSLKFNPEGVAS